MHWKVIVAGFILYFASVMKYILQVVQGMYLIPLLEVNIVIFITTTGYAREFKIRRRARLLPLCGNILEGGGEPFLFNHIFSMVVGGGFINFHHCPYGVIGSKQ